MSSSPGNDSYMGRALSIVVVGADGSVAMEKTYPALYSLFKRGLLPENVKIYCLTSTSSQKMKDSVRASLVLQNLAQGMTDSSDVEEFLKIVVHHKGDFSDAKTMALLGDRITKEENDSFANRVFYFAVPEDSVLNVAKVIKNSKSLYNGNGDGWTRLVLEKSSARDTKKSASRADELANLFEEKSLYRIDHYLGMEMVQNMLVMRFANSIFEPIWNRNHVAAVYVVSILCVQPLVYTVLRNT
jgi:glucose-6-phosphate 1-dehydrogenase